jgi:cobalt-zinc-cadmium efflux system outer membrane protein
MFIKARRIAIVLATLILTAPAHAQQVRSDVERDSTHPESQSELTAFVGAVVDANPQVNAARAALDASVALEGAAGRPLYNPELELEVEDADSETRAIGISQTLDWGGKRRARTAVAESETRSIEADFLSVRWQVASDLLAALAYYQTESDRSALATVRASTMQDFAELAEQRFEAGDISQIELDLAVLAFTDARIKQATASANVAEAKQSVSSLAIGSPPAEWPAIQTELSALSVAPSQASDLVMSLPHVRAAQLRVAAAAAQVELRQRERRLDPTLTLRGGTEDDETLVGLNITVPLPIRNRYTYEVTAASAERRQAQQEASNISRQAYARFLGAQERYQLSRTAWEDWQQTGGVSLQRQTDLLWRLWEAGELSTTEFLVQLQQTLDTRESALELREALWRAWFEWLTASGQIENWLGTSTTY